MVFTTFAFAKFFAVVLVGLALMPNRTMRQLLLLVASAYFYAYWNASFLLLLLTPSVIDYWCSLRISGTEDPRQRRKWLLVSIITNLGLLAYFKYANFFLENIGFITGRSIPHLDIILPAGISFYTFKTLSYTIDVYRREIPASRSLWQYAMFVTYFPELIAGPIVRASIFLPQMTRSLRPSWSRAFVGSQIVLLGVTKKLLVADRLAIFVDPVFADPAAFEPWTVISAVVAYSLQIYCDFSGYSDIAIGISKIIGFDLPENFNMPYASLSMVEFWRRWHMTLSSWLRDYLYIPLGGNRRGRLNTYRNLMMTMLLGGLWHGASWNFVFWGFLHGSALAANHWWTRDRKQAPRGAPRTRQSWAIVLCKWVATYGFTCVTWVFFRSRDFGTSLLILRKMFGLDTSGSAWFYSPLFLLIPLIIGAHYLGVVAGDQLKAPRAKWNRVPSPSWATRFYRDTGNRFALKPSKAAGIYVLLPVPGIVGGAVLAFWILGIFLFSSLNTAPFIYFQF
jgi:alginate O-acetyltransferase complex protein AlgI